MLEARSGFFSRNTIMLREEILGCKNTITTDKENKPVACI